jgi:RNA polymerase sigma-70 factor (TIGR02943 family)
MAIEQPVKDISTTPDPSLWVDQHGDYLYKYAVFRLRDPGVAEDIVQETLLAALKSYKTFEGRGSERTWLVGILKHKIIDHFRRTSRETPLDLSESQQFEHDEFFLQEGEWIGHWRREAAPTDWGANPADLLQQSEFIDVFQKCLMPLPDRVARAFTLREVDGFSSKEICQILNITVNNLWVMLHRARMHLRRCIEMNWFNSSARKR